MSRRKMHGCSSLLWDLLTRFTVKRFGLPTGCERKLLPGPNFFTINRWANDLTLPGFIQTFFYNVVFNATSHILAFRNLKCWSNNRTEEEKSSFSYQTFVIENGGKAILHESIRTTEVSLYSKIGNSFFTNCKYS